MKFLFVLNDAPYGNERSYNGLRLVLALAKHEGSEIKVFLMADAVACAKAGQKTPDGSYNIERMLRGCVAKHAEIGACGTCMDARGLADADLMAGTRRSTMAELAEWSTWADKLLVF
jgi:uncharacterized protein involved in oxidation of intracellular sulfur